MCEKKSNRGLDIRPRGLLETVWLDIDFGKNSPKLLVTLVTLKNAPHFNH